MKRARPIFYSQSQGASSQKSTTSTVAKKKNAAVRLGRGDFILGKTATGFPKTLSIRHKYSDSITFACSAGSTPSYVYSCNGMYDPDITGTGHQPLYYDQLAAIYNHYHVVASKFKLTLTNSSTSVSQNITVFVNDDSTIVPNYQSIKEQSSASSSIVVPFTSPLVMTKYWSAKKNFGGSIISNPNLEGTVSSNPTEQSTFCVFAQASDGSGSVTTFGFVEIEYTAVWTELKDIAQS